MYALFFSILLLFLLLFIKYLEPSDENIEGLTNNDATTSSSNNSTPSYQSYSGNNPMILAQKNAANIQYLQERLKELQTLETNFSSLEKKVTNNNSAITQLSKLASQHISQSTGVSTSNVTPSAINNITSIGSSAGNKLSPSTAPVSDITPA